MAKNLSLEYAREKDQNDPLASFIDEFHIPTARESYEDSTITDDRKCIYLSRAVGTQPKATEENILQVLKDWKTYGVSALARGFLPTIHCEGKVKPLLAPLVGAKESEIAVMNHLSVNLHLLMNSFYVPKGNRRKIIIEDGCFPSDYWICRSHIEMSGNNPDEDLVVIKPREGELLINDDDIISKIRELGDELQLVLLPGTQYSNGQAFDIPNVVIEAHKVGAYAGFDLAAVVGDMELSLHDWNVDFAVWAHYKYLNGGLGSVGGAFIHSNINIRELNKCRGWWATRLNTRFLCEQDDNVEGTVQDYAISHPSSFSIATLYTSLKIHERANIKLIRQKSKELTIFAYDLIRDLFGDNVTFITPEDPEKRGSQCTLRIKGYNAKMHHWCRQQGCVFDFRKNQDCLRFSVIPLNVTFEDIYNFVHYLHKAWSNPELSAAGESSDGFQKDYGVKANNEDTMKAAY